jgi:hypothetical protein
MSDDIVTLMRTDIQECDCNFRNGKCFLCIIEIQAADEIERLRTLLDNTLERENKNDARQLEIVRKVEADRDRWAKWGKHVFTCPNKGINPCRECVSPATADAMNRVDNGGTW